MELRETEGKSSTDEQLNLPLAVAGASLAPRLPEATPLLADPCDPKRTRRGVIAEKQSLYVHRQLIWGETKGMRNSPEKHVLYKQMDGCSGEARFLEEHLQSQFIPPHGPNQLLSPRAFFVSPLFRVCRDREAREAAVKLDLLPKSSSILRYEGPELRQCDGLVFLTLLHLLRDVQVGTSVSVHPDEICKAIFGGYDGHKRKKLQEHIQRLQKGLIILAGSSVQLCLRFDFPTVGSWTVGLDPKIVELFKVSPETWLRLEPRLALSSGLTTWLFSFVEAQTRLIPMQLNVIREACGSKADEKGFCNRMRKALKQLAGSDIIDTGWKIRRGELHWRKPGKNRDTRYYLENSGNTYLD